MPLRGAQKSPASALGQRFTIYAALEEMGSKQSFAAAIPKVYYADKVSIRCTHLWVRL